MIVAVADVSLVFRKALFRYGIERILSDAGYRVIDSVDDPAQLAPDLPADGAAPRLLLVDTDTAAADDCAAIRTLAERLAEARILVLGPAVPLDTLVRMFDAGAHGYLLDDSSHRSLLARIELALSGEQVVPPSVVDALIELPTAPEADEPDDRYGLTPRERLVLGHLVAGLSNKAIAREIGFSEPTIKLAVKTLMRKLEVANRTQAAIVAREQGLVE